MNIADFYKKYNFEDSLLENVIYDENEKKVILEVDFCYWQQENYSDEYEETGMIKIIFSNVKEFKFIPYAVNSDEIVNVSLNTNNCINIEVYNDVLEEYHNILISAESVLMVAENNHKMQ